MWFRLRLSPTHEFSALCCASYGRCALHWSHLDMVKHYPNHADHPLKTVGRLTNIFQHYRFTDDYLSHLVLDDASFKSILKDQDPTLYDKLIQVFEENQPITIQPGIKDNFSWKKCICVEPCATGEWTIQQFLKVYEQHRFWIMHGSPTSRFDAAGMNEEEHERQQEANVETPPEPRCHCQCVVESGFGLSDKALEDSKARRRGINVGEHVKPKRPTSIFDHNFAETSTKDLKKKGQIRTITPFGREDETFNDSRTKMFGFGVFPRNNLPEKESVEEEKMVGESDNNNLPVE